MESNKQGPSYYQRGKIQVWDFIRDQCLSFHLGNAVKYICRAGHKKSNSKVQDLEKAIHYLQNEVENSCESPNLTRNKVSPQTQQALEFRRAYNLTTPSGIKPQTINLQSKLIEEEAQELKFECDVLSAHIKEADWCPYLGVKTRLLKELADLVYVCFQMAAAFGWDLDEACRRVHESNLSKLGEDGKPILDFNGKVLKGPNYKEPNLLDLVR